MEQVVTINLGGNPYQLDESAYDALRGYMARAAAALADNPDKDEIVGDLEQAIADKAGGYLGPGKSVISQAEMAHILDEMGPVDGETAAAEEEEQPQRAADPGASASSASASGGGGGSGGEKQHRRLYRLPQGAMIAGVCNGLAAYLQVDVAIVRLVFILIAFLGHGWGLWGFFPALVVYVVLAFVIPSAHTPAQWAQAHGAPFNAQDIIDRAKREYEDFTAQNGPLWSKKARRAMRRVRKAARRAARYSRDWSAYVPPQYAASAAAPAYHVNPIAGAIAGFINIIFSLISAALGIAFIVVLISLIATGAVLGVVPPANLPVWAAVVIVIFVFGIVSSPITAIRRGARGVLRGGYPYYHSAFDGFVWLALIGVGGWLAYLYVPPAHAWMDEANIWIQHAWAQLNASLPK